MAARRLRTSQPIDRVVAEMTKAAAESRFELAARWRERFEQLEWLLAATSRARSALDLLTFVYRDTGVRGDDQAHIVRQRLVPITGALPLDAVDEVLLVHSWFRVHPEALRRTTALDDWHPRPS